jgi:linoleate 10R-lipoxygenase
MTDINPVQAFSLVSDTAYLSKRPPPIAPDGYYDWQVSSDPVEQREGHATVTNLVNRVSGLPGCHPVFFIVFF